MNFGTIQVADIFVGALNATGAYFGTEKVWEKSAPPAADWLCFTAVWANSTVKLNKIGSPDAISLETSTDGNTWTDYSWRYNTGDTLTLTNVGDKVYMRAKTENQTIGSGGWGYYQFVMSGLISASGNI